MSLRLASYFVLAHSAKNVLAANSGSLDAGSNKNTGKLSADTVAAVGVTTAATAGAAEAVSAAATAAATAAASGVKTVATTAAEATTAAATETTKGTTAATSNTVTYNQWGFIGTERLWVATTATTETLSGSKSSSVTATVLTASSGAQRLKIAGVNSEERNFKKFAVIGTIVGVSAILGGL